MEVLNDSETLIPPTVPALPAKKPSNRGKKFPVETLTGEEVARLIKQCSPRCPTGLRNRALIVCLWRCGLRVSEALALQVKDIDVDAGTIRVMRGKGQKCRVVGCDPQALAVIQLWLNRRAELPVSRTSPVFCTLDGSALAAVYVRNMFKRIGHKAGISKRVHPHSLRHSHASELLNEGVNLGIISRQLGHSSISVTARYVAHINPKDVVDTIKARTW